MNAQIASLPKQQVIQTVIPNYESKETLIGARNIHVRFGDKVVLRGVNIEIKNLIRPGSGIEQGQVVALLAPSGMGKTQLFRCIAGLQKPTEGEVLLTANNTPVKTGMVGVVPQNYPLFVWRTVLGNLQLAARAKGLSQSDAKTEAMKMLAYFGLEHIAKNYPSEISGGQQQRVAIARQILSSDHFLLMDEPFSGLDILAKESLIRKILELSIRHEQETLIVTTHDITSAVSIADRVLILGRDHDQAGNPIPGAYVRYDFNLINEGLAWQPNVTTLSRFTEMVRYIEHDIFKTL